MASSPKSPEKTAEELAIERRQRSLLDDEIGESEDRLKALARGSLGRASLLSGAPANRADASGGSRGSRGGAASMISGGGVGSGPVGGSRPSAPAASAGIKR